MKLKFSKNAILSVVFAILLVVFAFYLIKSLDKTGREGSSGKTVSFGTGKIGTTKPVVGGIKSKP